MVVTREALDVQGNARLVASPWENTSSTAQTIKVETPYDEVPYDDEVFQKLAALPNKAPDLPHDGDDDL